MKRLLPILSAAATGLLLPNCAVDSSPQARIDRNYSLYESLPAKDRGLVSQGQIAKGMSKQAVYLALGDPSRKVQGFRDGSDFERWDYTRLHAHYYNHLHGYFGRGYGRSYGWDCGPYGSYSGIGIGPTIEYVPYRSSSVVFRRGRVDSWERFTPGPY